MDNEKQKQILALYEQLDSLLRGLGDSTTGSRTVGGPFYQYLKVIDELTKLTEQDLEHFIPRYNDQKGDKACSTRDLIAEISGLLGWIRGNYLPDKQAHYLNTSSPANQIMINQEVNVTQSMIINITELLTARQDKFSPDSKERNFIDKVKAGLASVKDAASILNLIIQTASQCGLSLAELSKIFS
jgi:hypothetical protein